MLDWYPDSTGRSLRIGEVDSDKDATGVPLWPEHTICEEFNAKRCI